MKQEVKETSKGIRGKSPRVIRATISTVKARKIINRVAHGEYSQNPILRDTYLAGIRDIIGEDLGWSFRRAVLTGDIKQVARFCSDGWKVLGCRPEAFTGGRSMKRFLMDIRKLCVEAIKECK